MRSGSLNVPRENYCRAASGLVRDAGDQKGPAAAFSFTSQKGGVSTIHVF
jgi:hypothetical protein